MATAIPRNDASFRLDEILAATGGRVMGALTQEGPLCGVTTDSRRVRPGELFVALKGESFDGHRYVGAAAEAGAGLAIVDRDVSDPPLTTVRVDDTWRALRGLAEHHLARWRQSGDRRVLAITGSAGKTTTKAAMGALLAHLHPGEAHVTAGNLNNLVGVPMTIFGLTEAHRYGVLEMGTNQPGEIPTLTRLGRPDVAMVTLISAAHTEGLGGIDGVEREKLAMFREARDAAIRIGNADDDRVRRAIPDYGARGLGYGEHERATYRLVGRRLEGVHQRVELSIGGRALTMSIPLLGYVGALSVAGAVAGVEALLQRELVDGDQLSAALRAFDAGRRFRLIEAGGLYIVDDTYNANPASCAASVSAAAELAESNGRRLILVLGEMKELGDESLEAHRTLGRQAAEKTRDVIAIGGDARHLAEAAAEAGAAALFVEDAEDAIAPLRERLASPQDCLVLVKASRSIRAERVVDALIADAP